MVQSRESVQCALDKVKINFISTSFKVLMPLMLKPDLEFIFAAR